MSEKPAKVTALTAGQLAKALSAAGGRRITEDMVRADIEAGAPVNPDGMLNLIHYTAWLVKEMACGD
jgi:hypothetical protein